MKKLLTMLLVWAPVVLYAPCIFIPDPDTFDRVFVVNSGQRGWLELYNTTDKKIRVVNAKDPQYSYLLSAYKRRSFNWNFRDEITCFLAKDTDSDNRAADTQVNCSDVIAISQCLEEEPTVRFNDLNMYQDIAVREAAEKTSTY